MYEESEAVAAVPCRALKQTAAIHHKGQVPGRSRTMGRHHRLLSVLHILTKTRRGLYVMVHGSKVEGKEQRNKEAEQCDVVGALWRDPM